jgi:hapalindole H/12-epi-hapalindole U/12-epi-fischerindole U synthase
VIIVRYLLSLTLLVIYAASTRAVSIPIVNAGFEAPYLAGNLPPAYNGDVPSTAFPTGAPPAGWQTYGAVGGNAFVGVLNPGVLASEPLATYFPAGAPEGDNVALLFYDGHLGGAEFGIMQTLASNLTANTLYTLTAAVGNIASGRSAVQPYAGFGNFDLRGFPGYRVQLLAGGIVVASDNGILHPDEGTFATTTVQFIVSGSHPQLNQPLGIRLVNRNQADIIDPVIDLEVDFDAIALDASPFDPTDLPGDYNNDGRVDGADFVLWREHLGSYQLLPNDPLGGQIGTAQYTQWRDHHGDFAGGGSATIIHAAGEVPEPAVLRMLVAALIILAAGRHAH